jgi:hypothetical protein
MLVVLCIQDIYDVQFFLFIQLKYLLNYLLYSLVATEKLLREDNEFHIES